MLPVAVALHRSAWIEIGKASVKQFTCSRRTPQECVDRNSYLPLHPYIIASRTPQECVDRNATEGPSSGTPNVALHRSAWIEIAKVMHINKLYCRRTPQECVDRNLFWVQDRRYFFCRTPQECVDRNICLLEPLIMVV